MITTGVGTRFKEELFLGIHELSEGVDPDLVRAALYGPNADIGPSTNTYTTSGEIAGGVYPAGGILVPMTVVGVQGSPRNAGVQFNVPYLQPTNDLQLSPLGSVGIRGLMLYNSSKSNRNIFTLDFGEILTPDSNSGIAVRWGVGNVVSFNDVLIPILSGSL